MADEIKLLDFPDEILLEIFSSLSDHTLLQVIGVCKRFKIIAKASFTQKCSGLSAETFYSLKVFGESLNDEQKQYQQVFRKFGGNMKAIDIGFNGDLVVRNHWLITLIQRYCKSITKVKIKNGKGVDLHSFICCMPNISHIFLHFVCLLNQKWTQYTYPKLVHFSASLTKEDLDAFAVFIDHNAQLEHLYLSDYSVPPNNVLCTLSGKLNQLKHCELYTDQESFTENESPLKMDSLKSLIVRANPKSFESLLTYIQSGLQNLENLTILLWSYYNLRPRDINLLCSLKMLKSLDIHDGYELSFELLQILIMHLPTLVSFTLGDAENLCNTPDDLLSVVSVCQKLSLLELIINLGLPSLDYSFCTRFADIMGINGSNLKMTLCCDTNDKMIFTRDEAHFIGESMDDIKLHRILYWKGYDAACSSSKMNLLELKKEVLTKVAMYLNGNALSSLAQTCMRGQRFVVEFLAENRVFHCTVTPKECTNENVFMVLGEHIRRIKINLYHFSYDDDDDENVEGTPSHKLKTKFMQCINQYCGNSLTEMEIKDIVQIQSKMNWPNLKKLKLFVIHIQKLQRFHCPELTHLNIVHFEKSDVDGSVDWSAINFPNLTSLIIERYENIVHSSVDWAENSFPNLNSLTFGCYNESVESFLNGLNGRICNQMKVLSIKGSFENNERRHWLKLTNIVSGFGRLVTLHLYNNGIEESNFKILFENCSMLVELTICYCYKWRNKNKFLEVVRTIKRQCKQIEVVRLVGKKADFDRSGSFETIHSMFPKGVIEMN